MSTIKIFTTNVINFSTGSFCPRNYDPVYLFVKEKLNQCPRLHEMISEPVTGGSTPPAYFFTTPDQGVPFVKTSAVSRHLLNINDLYYIAPSYHKKSLKRSITRPYDVIFTMTGKFMGKAALCPPTIKEMNMSQNSVLLRCQDPLIAAFLVIFLNSQINKIQVRGVYSITKQKFMNQTKVKNLRIVPYHKKYNVFLESYIKSIDNYYTALKGIQEIIEQFSYENKLQGDYGKRCFSFTVNASDVNTSMLVPDFYRPDIAQAIGRLKEEEYYTFSKDLLSKGDEIGSANYSEDGVPFIKTSDIMNFDIDYEPDCYCSESFVNQLEQNIRKGDIIFTKDGKLGQVALIQNDANIVLSSGLVKYHPKNNIERYWLFLLLSSEYGMAFFSKWFVIASTMSHLRKDFFEDFAIPHVNETIETRYIRPLEKLFITKENAYNDMQNAKNAILDDIIDID